MPPGMVRTVNEEFCPVLEHKDGKFRFAVGGGRRRGE